jgi:sucrose phosphorylase
VRNQVQLITYADRLAGSLPGLAAMLDGPLHGMFGGVHILPFFTPFDGADAGFDPVDHREVDPRLGTWDDVAAVADRAEVVADLIVNHVSSDSPSFRDVVARGDASPYAGMFLTYATLFPGGATEDELLQIYRPRPGLPFTAMRLGGRRRLVWTTFTDKQIDLDVRDPQSRDYLTQILRTLARNRVRLVRIDAVGYAVKTPGTSSFMTPETFAFIDELTAEAKQLGLEVLVEVHSYYKRQVEIAQKVDVVYDFGLPPLVLYAVHFGDVGPLLRWLDVRPANCVTVLDTHDGIGVIDVGADATAPDQPGLLEPAQLSALVEAMHVASGGTSRQATGAAASNLDLYQVNCTFYDAVGRDDDRYLLARAVQFFVPGVPQVYYVGLLAGVNDMDLLARTGVGRDVNRHSYTPDEVAEALAQPVVVALVDLIRLRNTHPAFGGDFTFGPGSAPPAAAAPDAAAEPAGEEPAGREGAAEAAATSPDGRLWLRWTRGGDLATLEVDAATATFRLTWTTPDGVRTASR